MEAKPVPAPQPRPRAMAEPLHIQRLEAALNMRPFMNMAKRSLRKPLSSDEETDDEHVVKREHDVQDSDDSSTVGVVRMKQSSKRKSRLLASKEERQSVKAQLYNFNDLTSDREWLYDLLLSDTESDDPTITEDEYVQQLLREHVREQRQRKNYYKKAANAQYAYYGSGLLSNHDIFAERQLATAGVRKRRRRTKQEILMARLAEAQAGPKPPKQRRRGRKKRDNMGSPESGEVPPSELGKYTFGDTLPNNEDDDEDGGEVDYKRELASLALDYPEEEEIEEEVDVEGGTEGQVTKVRRKRKNPAALAARRRRIWQIMSKKESGRLQRIKSNNHKEMLANCKRVAGMCAKVVRQRAINSQRIMKETVWRAKRLTREMLAYWKRYERVERDQRRKQEREAEEQRKQDVELIEVKRQQRKLNFLITQTELYAHFMSKKLGQGSEEDQLRILSQLDEETNARLAAQDDYDAGEMKLLAQENAEAAMQRDLDKTRAFDVFAKKKEKEEEEQAQESVEDIKPEPRPEMKDLPQPKMFKGTLKGYQIKGMTWLANIYDQGISGILADEMGLGKTVQSIAFLCHIAEHYGVWGPFLVISPASTLHNWQQEMSRFVPDFKVVPYWGSPAERKILRQFWDQKHLHTRDASFHVVITSYQLVVSDYKYFNRIKWQYMVLDEAQAIKSAASQRWKLLLGFSCRNRLLLSGTPIQNSMAELWALLHFIMPTLFDSHDEFNEWFSKDIESHAENKTGIDEKQISRLHMILKPFMLRRIKKDVENELSDKIEIMVYCPLTIRQKLLYRALKQKIRIEDLLHLTSGSTTTSSSSSASNLMNLVMQFRKVCNHPELFERRDARSPFFMRCAEYTIPRLIHEEGLIHRMLPSRKHLLYNRFNIFKSEYIQRSLFEDVNVNSCFGFTRLCDLSVGDMVEVTLNGLIDFLLHYRRVLEKYPLLAYRRFWWKKQPDSRYQLLEPMLENKLALDYMPPNSVLKNFIFTAMTANESSVYAFGDYFTYNMQETIEHRVIRSKILKKKTSLIEEMEDVSKQKLEIESVEVQTKSNAKSDVKVTTLLLLPEFPHRPRKPRKYVCEPLSMPRILYDLGQKVQAVHRYLYCDSRSAAWSQIRHNQCENSQGRELVSSGLALCKPHGGWSSIVVPDKETLITDAGKLFVLDNLLTRLKANGHRVLIYSQMTKMIDLLEEYMWHRKHRYMRLDGSSKISARRDMVADFQTRADIFVFLLSTRAGGLGINLTAADTVIFYDSDWNPTVDQQAMDRAHRLGQTKQVTVYRLICKGTIEERILQRAREKSEIQRMVISGGNFKPDTLKPKEVVSLLLDDEEIEMKYRQEAKLQSSSPIPAATQSERKRRHPQKDVNMGGTTIAATSATQNPDDDVPSCSSAAKRIKLETEEDFIDVGITSSASSVGTDSNHPTLSQETYVPGATCVQQTEIDSENEALVVDGDSPTMLGQNESMNFLDDLSGISPMRRRHHPRGTRRGRPRGSTRRGGGHGSIPRVLTPTQAATPAVPATASQAAAAGTGAAAGTSSPLPQQEVSGGGDNAGVPLHEEEYRTSPSGQSPGVSCKRGPGRPRSKTATPISRGTRGAPRARRPMGPLLVPLGRSPDDTPPSSSPATSRAPSPLSGSHGAVGPE
uniref:Chromatin-remodeling ATPase INO80 n=2 Tax=Drosophila melanogaster TaxID=7227 RepID=INO80_DROME|nr:INO80 complex subunit [Drosophila melanogaster]Q9VDY1.2 RecName: Full=Chromatin-remodeling ATPase INO80; Short=dINO80 [Drosophila melanogaster]AAF55658.2 INO80 complex subunit [Drosophila melanogaster]AFH41853.1 FI17525p1 [Drosophila melanogaster]|eukprot:NP_732413.1 INO80 complex subunit [Drosophila melanogaster]